MNFKFCLKAGLFLCAGVAFVSSANNSFSAPLVQQSMLLDIDHGAYTTVVGERGHVLIKAAEASDFEQIIVPTKTTLTAVTSFASSAWAVGHDATIINSSDQGVSWQVQLSMPELDRPFLDVLFFDASHGLAVGAYGLFYRTMDGGITWSKEMHPSVLPQDDLDYLESIKDDVAFYNEELSFILPHFNRLSFDGTRLMLAGEAGLIAQSDDFGKSWKRTDIDYFGSFFDVVNLDNDIMLAAGLRGNLFVKSNDDDWQKINTCVTTSLNSIVNDGNHLYVTGNNGVLLTLNRSALFSENLSLPDSDNCRRSDAVQLISQDLSDAILNAINIDGSLLAVTASGLKSLEVK